MRPPFKIDTEGIFSVVRGALVALYAIGDHPLTRSSIVAIILGGVNGWNLYKMPSGVPPQVKDKSTDAPT